MAETRERKLRAQLQHDIMNVALAGATGRPGDMKLATTYILETVDALIAERVGAVTSGRRASGEGDRG